MRVVWNRTDPSDNVERAVKAKPTSQLVALSSAAVLAVYTAGYMRTRAAAARIAGAADRPRLVVAAPAVVGEPLAVPAPSSSIPGPQRPADAQPAPVVRNPGAVRPAARAKAAQPSASLGAGTPPPAKAAASAPAPAVAATDDLKTAGAVSAVPPPSPTPPPPTTVPPGAAVPPTAAAPAAPPASPAGSPATVYKDGTYTGWGTSRHGDIQATVVIEGGKILSATISQCLTRYSCSVIEKLPPQVAARQSPEVDYVSGATQSTNAFYYAVVDALSKAK